MNLNWDDLNTLERSHGDSFYLLEPGRFDANFTDFLGAFQRHYPRTRLAYSYKTNYLPAFCRRARALGGYAEVVSRMEYDLAIRLGVPPAEILFNGPYKTPDDIESALLAGAVVNLDSPYEIPLVERIAQRHPGQRLAVGLRCNLAEADAPASRFGFAVGVTLDRAVERLRTLASVDLVGLHCHYCTADKSVGLYASIAGEMLDLAKRYFPAGGLRFIDLGGGFFSRMDDSLARQFPCPVPSFDDYAAAIGSRFAETFTAESGPELILEPGLALVADAMSFCAKVIDCKQIGSRRIALVSGSVYDIKPTLNQKALPVSRVSRNPRPGDETGVATDIVGYTCMEHDVLQRDYRGEIEPGDYLVFRQTGAYTVVLRPPFIRPCPPILSLDPVTGKAALASRGETLDDILARHV